MTISCPTAVVTVEFGSSALNVSESDCYANVTVVKLGSTTSSVRVTMTTGAGTATGKGSLLDQITMYGSVCHVRSEVVSVYFGSNTVCYKYIRMPLGHEF